MIEDSRKVMQDFTAPELRAVDTRLKALEKRIDGFEANIDKRFDMLEQQIDRKFDQILHEIRWLKTVHDLELRMAKYEAMLPSQQHDAPRRSRPESEAA